MPLGMVVDLGSNGDMTDVSQEGCGEVICFHRSFLRYNQESQVHGEVQF